MLKILFIYIWSLTLLLTSAQTDKPRQALRELGKKHEALFKEFERDVEDRKAQTWEWDDRAGEIRQLARDIGSTYKIPDWEGEELLALAEINLLAEDFDNAVLAYRAFLAADPRKKEVDGVDVRARLARALTESDRPDEAARVIEELKRERSNDPFIMAALVSLYKDLAVSYRDRGLLARAADAAFDGYQVANVNRLTRLRSSRITETVLRDQFTMAAIYVALNEQMSRNKTAADFDKSARNFDFRGQIYLRDHYGKELTTARLVGRPAPELKPGLEADGTTIGELQGKVVLLDFHAMWCAPCVAGFRHWREFQSRHGDRGFKVIGVTRLYGRTDAGVVDSSEAELEALRAFRKKYDLDYPFVVGRIDDVTNEERFGVDSIPTTVLIDKRGRIRHIKRGIGDYRKLERFIVRLLNEAVVQ